MNETKIFAKVIGCVLCFLTVSFHLSAQTSGDQLTGVIRGIIIDHASAAPLPYVTISLVDMPGKGTVTSETGEFALSGILLGRHTLRTSFVGYEPNTVYEILLTSAKEVYLEISLKENVLELDEVVITTQKDKSQPLNKMALLGAHMLSVEEASRFAGGLDDPARLVSSFAGVSPGVSTNGISVHGNAPSLLQWRLEGVEIPNPNHFADVSTLGGGVLSSLSGNVLGNSDFFTGAFPAEYSNAVSGVFDMKLRNGNNRNFEHTFQAGVLGLDFASEGPISKTCNSSYIFNYRYSTTGLMSKLEMASSGGVLDYQDLNFKLNFPTKNAGIFSVWGTGLIDKAEPDLEYDPQKWKYKDDGKASTAKQTSAAGGINHRYFFENDAYLRTTLATTFAKNDAWEDIYDNQLNASRYLDFDSRYVNLVFTSSYNRKYNSRHTNKTGFTMTNMSYDMDLKVSPFDTQPLQTISSGNGNTNLIAVYSSSSVDLSNNLSMTLGISGQWLVLNNNWTIEPRAGIKWQASEKSSLALAYGLHSRMEKTDVYFVQAKDGSGKLVNKNLDFVKTHHVMLSYNFRISDNTNFRIEPYFQYLYDVPVIADSSYSILNRSTFYVEESLVNTGKGRNLGIDFTLEKYLTKGLYYMITASVFDSWYCGGGVWHNTKFNRNFIINGLIGKEWMLGRNKQNVLGINLKVTIQGGDRYSPVEEQASLAHPDKKVQYDETHAYSRQFSPMFLGNYTVSYRMNRKKTAHEFAIKGINATQYQEYYGHEYNLNTGVIEPKRSATSLLNVSYKLEF